MYSDLIWAKTGRLTLSYQTCHNSKVSVCNLLPGTQPASDLVSRECNLLWWWKAKPLSWCPKPMFGWVTGKWALTRMMV